MKLHVHTSRASDGDYGSRSATNQPTSPRRPINECASFFSTSASSTKRGDPLYILNPRRAGFSSLLILRENASARRRQRWRCSVCTAQCQLLGAAAIWLLQGCCGGQRTAAAAANQRSEALRADNDAREPVGSTAKLSDEGKPISVCVRNLCF